jgi:aerobic-type carbon monoxide dehydrogenase small subunit (CoxS/CutS family)
MKEEPKSKKKEVSRRDFIKGMGGGALGAAVAPKLLAQDVSSVQTSAGSVALFGKKEISLHINGRSHTLAVTPADTLLAVLRDRLNLTGTKQICDRGECGGCTVLLEGKPVYACMYLAVRADGKNITTIEGLAVQDKLHPLQQAFIDEDGYQCGFCSPGIIMTSAAFLSKNQSPDLTEIKQALSGNLCRCGNYAQIYKAVSEAAKKIRGV